MAMSSGRVKAAPERVTTRTRSASRPYRLPRQSGQGMSTSGRNCTSRLIWPVPSQVGQRSFPVL